MTAQQKLNMKIAEQKHICVGLDTDYAKLPESVKGEKYPQFEFNKRIIDSTYKEAACYKVNLAFYEARGIAGLEELEKTMEYMPDDMFVIGDAKRGDIGNTSRMYAESLFDHFRFDASTLHPYMGIDSLDPFFKYEDKIHFVLVLTSNPGSADFEKLVLNDGTMLFEKVLAKLHEWNSSKNIGLVFGATNPEELKENMVKIGDLPVLLPGIGAQKGNLEEILGLFSDISKTNFIINVSRGIIFSGLDDDFGKSAEIALNSYNKKISEGFYNK